MGAVPAGENKDYDEVERFFKNPTYEGTSSTINNMTSTRAAVAASVMYDTVGQPSSSRQTMTTMTTTIQEAAGNGHMYEALDKQDANGTTPQLYIQGSIYNNCYV